MRYTSTSEKETKSIAKDIVSKYKDIHGLFFLIGNLGVGKTVFTKGVAEYLDVKDNILSPTFGIKSEYDGMTHYDLYLSEEKANISSVLYEDEEKGIVVIEWADKLPKKILRKGVQITIERNGDDRVISVKEPK